MPGGRARHVRRRLSRPGPQPDQDERRHADGGELEPVLHGLDERDRAHAARGDVGEDHHRDDQPAEPGRCAGHGLQRQPGALELRQEVEPADPEDEDGAQPAHRAALEPGLGEVRQRVGAGPAQRGGDEDEQHEVAHRVADGEPQHVGAEGVDQPGDAEERGGREVLAADRRGVPARRDGAAGDVEVAGGAREAQAERADPERHQADQGDGDDAVRRVHRRATRSVKSRSIRSECRT